MNDKCQKCRQCLLYCKCKVQEEVKKLEELLKNKQATLMEIKNE